MTDYSDWWGWHVWTDANGVVQESWAIAGGWRGFEIVSEDAADLARRDREEGLGVTRNFVQFLPPGVRPTQF